VPRIFFVGVANKQVPRKFFVQWAYPLLADFVQALTHETT
jgi:hypothetical protein